MARWRLNEAHYLSVERDGEKTEWEQIEISQATGRQFRKRHIVSLHLNPKEPSDWNYPGEIVVGNRENGRDIVYMGPPTPAMEPLDDEAEALSKTESKKWAHPIEGLGTSYGDQLFAQFSRQLEAILKNTPIPQAANAVAASSVTMEQFAEMQAQMAILMEQNARLMARLDGAEAPEDEEPLPPPPAPAEASAPSRRG